MSSAYRWIQQSEQIRGRSLINIENKRGPKEEPWGTPFSIIKDCDIQPLT